MIIPAQGSMTDRCHPGQLDRRPSKERWQRAREDTLRVEDVCSVNGSERERSTSSTLRLCIYGLYGAIQMLLLLFLLLLLLLFLKYPW